MRMAIASTSPASSCFPDANQSSIAPNSLGVFNLTNRCAIPRSESDEVQMGRGNTLKAPGHRVNECKRYVIVS